MDLEQLMPHVEALIFASERPLTQLELLDLLNQAMEEGDAVTEEQLAVALDAIREKYDADYYPFGLQESGGGYVFLTKPKFHSTVTQLNGDKFIKKLSTAAMETLAIIAYKQPITKSDIEYIRGVSVDYSIQKLLEKDLIVITGKSEDLPGKPLLYGTSRQFMDYLGISNVDDLPRIRQIIPEEAVEPTDSVAAVPEDLQLIVSEEGELLQRKSA